jgi:hypothetical protein
MSLEEFCSRQKIDYEAQGGEWGSTEESICRDAYKEYLKANQEGKLPDTPEMKIPEISTLYGYGKYGKLGFAVGVELFHDRRKPRKHKWKFELQLAQDEVAFGVSRIIARGANLTIGPYLGYDVEIEKTTYGIRAGLFKF